MLKQSLDNYLLGAESVHASRNRDRWHDLYRKGNSLLQMMVAGITLVLLTSLTAGFLTQLFLGLASLRSEERKFQMTTMFWFPVLIILMAIFLHSLVKVVQDSMKTPPFIGIRSSFIAGECLRKENMEDFDYEYDDDYIQCFETMWFHWGFALFSIAGAIWLCWRAGFSPGEVWAGLISGAIVWTFINLIFFVIHDGVSLRCNEEDACPGHVRARLVRKVLKELQMWPGEPVPGNFNEKVNDLYEQEKTHFLSAPKGKRRTRWLGTSFWRMGCFGSGEDDDTSGSQTARAARQFVALKKPLTHRCYGAGAIPLFVGGIFSWTSFYYAAAWMAEAQWYVDLLGPDWSDNLFIILTSLVLLFSVFCLYSGVLEVHPPFRKCTHFHFFLILIFVNAFFLYTGVLFINGQLYHQDIRVVGSTVVNNSAGYSLKGDETPLRPIWRNDVTSPYPACSMRWTGDLSLLDLAPLAYYSYSYDEPQYDSLIEATFANAGGIDSVERVWMDNYTHAKQTGLPRVVATLFNRGHAGREVIVVAVKGTDLVRDAYADFALYSSIFVLQLGSFLIPVLDMLPNWFFAYVLAHFRAPLTITTENKLFWHVAHKILILQEKYPNAATIMTGHSLGGGIAAAIGGQMLIPAVVFSAPGAHFSRERFKTSLERQYRNVVNIRPDSDYVGRVDRNDEIVQSIECRNRDGTYASFPACHSISRTTCELWRGCGDPRNRDFGHACVETIKGNMLGAYFAGDDKPTMQTKETGFHPDSETSSKCARR